MSDEPKPRFQFSLRTMFWLATIAAVFLAGLRWEEGPGRFFVAGLFVFYAVLLRALSGPTRIYGKIPTIRD
jgi:hypothetical protein